MPSREALEGCFGSSPGAAIHSVAIIGGIGSAAAEPLAMRHRTASDGLGDLRSMTIGVPGASNREDVSRWLADGSASLRRSAFSRSPCVRRAVAHAAVSDARGCIAFPVTVLYTVAMSCGLSGKRQTAGRSRGARRCVRDGESDLRQRGVPLARPAPGLWQGAACQHQPSRLGRDRGRPPWNAAGWCG